MKVFLSSTYNNLIEHRKAAILDTEKALENWLFKLIWLDNPAITLDVFLLQSRQE